MAAVSEIENEVQGKCHVCYYREGGRVCRVSGRRRRLASFECCWLRFYYGYCMMPSMTPANKRRRKPNRANERNHLSQRASGHVTGLCVGNLNIYQRHTPAKTPDSHATIRHCNCLSQSHSIPFHSHRCPLQSLTPCYVLPTLTD